VKSLIADMKNCITLKISLLLTVLCISCVLSVQEVIATESAVDCDAILKELKRYSKLDAVDNSTLERSKQILSLLQENQCYAYTDHLVIKEDNKEVYIGSLTYIYGRICENNSSRQAVKYYIEYWKSQSGSAEEELSFAFERLFVSKPFLVFEEINRYDKLKQKGMLDSIAYGFLNNRYYGPSHPDSELMDKAFIVRKEPLPVVLNKSNYKEIFFQTNPKFKDLYKIYPEQIEYMFNNVEKYFEWLEHQRHE
jgi:hypothetical protein